MIKIRAFGAVGNARAYTDRPLVLSQYVKNYGGETGVVQGDCFFVDPNGRRVECQGMGEGGVTVEVPGGAVRFMAFQCQPNMKGQWEAHVIMDGMYYESDSVKTYWIPVVR